MKIPSDNLTPISKNIKVKEIIASLIDQARDKIDFAHYDEPDNIFVHDIRMLRQAALLLQKMQAKPVITPPLNSRKHPGAGRNALT